MKLALGGTTLVALLALAWLARPAAADEVERFVKRVHPILSAKCVSCHGPEKQEGNLRLDSLDAAKAGGDGGPAIVPGDVESRLLKAVSFADPELQMPPKEKLSDDEIATLSEWVKAGATWPARPAVLFEDEPQFLAALRGGEGRGRMRRDEAFSGRAALGMKPLQRDSPKIPNWNFPIRENPGPGEYRFLRLAWKKAGPGSVMIELARDGGWSDPKDPKGRYVAGPNGTDWAAIEVSAEAPSEWTVVTFDLWKDVGDFTLTGCSPTCDRGEEAFFDAIILGPTVASLDAYRPGWGEVIPATDAPASSDPYANDPTIGDAFADERNPIRRIFRGERLDLWSLKKPVKIAPPAGASHPIDAFVRARLASEKLAPSPEADRRTLIRRLTFDLHGLPPTPEEVDAFFADASPDAYEKLVERLLASPRYGERAAQAWLDVVRYADTNGYEYDEFRPLSYKFRDYVVRSFNADKPFDRFIREQLAGDETVDGAPKNEDEVDRLIATGYLRLGQWDTLAEMFQEQERLRAEVMADLTNTTASAFLGLTMACCQCHDHKYDPLSQADHYRLRAFFAGVERRDDLPISLASEQAAIDAHNEKIERELGPLRAKLEKLDEKEEKKREALEKKIAEIEKKKREPERAFGATDAGSEAPPTRILYQGDHLSPREETPAGFLSVFTPGPAEIRPPREGTTGRRTALAEWIASPDNPWTARVFVNRVWQRHFGVGLVATPNDFGYSGARPTHPELLDWLAIEFVERGWSVKELHRLIVTSHAYRQGSRETPDGRAIDPENKLLWRQNVRRADAETLRDSLLAVSGLLRHQAGGKPKWPPVPQELLDAQPAIFEARNGGANGRLQDWYADPIEETDVRSLYLVRKRSLPIPFLQAFDLPNAAASCARRDVTVVAPQALTLLNSPEGVRCVHAFAKRLAPDGESPSFADEAATKSLVERVFREALQRRPNERELALAIDFLRRHEKLHEAAGDEAAARALADLCRAALNLNEFVYVD